MIISSYKTTVRLGLLAILGISGAQGANYSIDFSQFAVPSGNWNSLISTNSTFSLVEFDTGATDGTTLTTLGIGSDSNISHGWNVGSVGWMVAEAGQDGSFVFPVASVTFNNLIPGTYKIMLVSSEQTGPPGTGGFPSTADFRVEGSFADANRLGTSANGDNWNTASDGLNNWMEWTSVTTAGSITLSIDASADGFTTINAIRLESLSLVPEPSTGLLNLLASIALMGRRRRN